MKIKNLLKLSLPILSSTALITPAVSCSKTASTGVDIVHEDGSKAHYESIEKALADIKNNDSIKLDGDAVITKTLEIKSVTGVTIDGNGHTLLLNDQANAPTSSVASFTACKDLKLVNLHIAGNAGGVGLTFLNTTVTMENVVASGVYSNVVVFNEKSGGTISNCWFLTQTGNENFDYTIKLSGDTTNPVTIQNTIADSVYVDGSTFENKRVEFKGGNNIRFIAADTECDEDNFKTGVVGYKNIETLWFGGVLMFAAQGAPIFYESYTHEGKVAEFVVSAAGLFWFNVWYRNGMHYQGKKVELHLMCDVDCDSTTFEPWQPLMSHTYGGQNDHLIDTFNGHGHTISHLLINDERSLPTEPGIGFFGKVDSVVVSDVTFDNCRLEALKCQDAGMVIGTVHKRTELHNVTVSNSYIGALKKVGSLVGIVDCDGTQSEDPEDINAWLTISGCTSDNCSVVNKAKDGDDVDVYLGGLVGWVAYHMNSGGQVINRGYIVIDDDPAKQTTLRNIHFNWQQESEDWDTNFEVALLFLYSYGPYRQCNSYVNVHVEYRDE